MTQEQKAKKYDEALEWMRELYPGLHGATKEDAELYFPELKESNDEKIRKELIELISCLHDADPRKKRGIAYLEKQKERGSLTKEEEYILHRIIEYLEDEACPPEWISLLHDIYCLPYEKQKDYHKLYEDIAQSEWFKKAYVGKSLGEEFEQKEQKPITINQDEKEFLADEITAFLCNYDKEFDGEDPVPSEVAEHFYLLGKQAQEQKPAEYIPDSVKFEEGFKTGRELGFREGVASIKSAEWSEEDEIRMESCMLYLANTRDWIEFSQYIGNNARKSGKKEIQKDIDWLKSLKDRGNFPKSNTNSPSEWSEDDEEMIEGIIGDLCALKDWIIKYDTNWLANPVLKNIDKRIDWLKPLRPQSKVEWSEEDEKMRKSIVQVLESFVSQANCESNPSLTASYPTYYKEIDWLKSLRSQLHWEPSEEQMEALSETIAFAPDTFKPKCTLVTLQDDLKNL